MGEHRLAVAVPAAVAAAFRGMGDGEGLLAAKRCRLAVVGQEGKVLPLGRLAVEEGGAAIEVEGRVVLLVERVGLRLDGDAARPLGLCHGCSGEDLRVRRKSCCSVMIGEHACRVEGIRLWLPAAAVVAVQPLPAAPLRLVKLPEQMEPAKQQ